MELRLPTEQQLRRVYERDLKMSFPAAELRPLPVICTLTRGGTYRPWCLFDGEEIVGEAFVLGFAPGWALFDYLCVDASRRNDGLGAKLIAKLLEAERGNVVFGESEIPDYAPDPDMARRRLRFYRRNGAQQAAYDTAVFGVPYHTLFWAERAVTDGELMAAHQKAYHDRFPPSAYRRFIQIPWDISMGVPKKIPWEE